MPGPISRRRLIACGIAAGLGGVSARPRSPGSTARATAPNFPAQPKAAPLTGQLDGRIRMYIYISNETDVSLTLIGSEVASGEFTPDLSPPAVILPGQRVMFEGEGDLATFPTSGTEGRVRYNIDAPDGGELYIHWNSPLIESDYGNTFHIWAPTGWEVTHQGGQGHIATLEIRLRRTAIRKVPNFHPHGRGIPFLNSWSGDLPVITLGYLWNQLFNSLPGPLGELGYANVLDDAFGPITDASAGLCGGMVFTVMDYYYNHLLPTDQQTAPASPDDPLFLHIRDRLWDSFDVSGEGYRYLAYSSRTYPNGDEGPLQLLGLARGRSWVTYREAFPQIQQDIDNGQLSPMGLIQTDNFAIGDNHQVLAYGYQKSGQKVTLFIYDPNEGQREVKYEFDITATDGEVHIERFVEQGPPANGTFAVANSKRIYAFFRTNNYTPKMPPNGRRFTSIRDTIRATTWQLPPYSVRLAMDEANSGDSVLEWMRSR